MLETVITIMCIFQITHVLCCAVAVTRDPHWKEYIVDMCCPPRNGEFEYLSSDDADNYHPQFQTEVQPL